MRGGGEQEPREWVRRMVGAMNMATATIAAAMGATRWPRPWACGASYGQGWRIFPMGGRRNALVRGWEGEGLVRPCQLLLEGSRKETQRFPSWVINGYATYR